MALNVAHYNDYLMDKYGAITSANCNTIGFTTGGYTGGISTGYGDDALVYNNQTTAATQTHISNTTIYGNITLGPGSTVTGCMIYGKGSTVESDALIEALFTLKPKLRRKYKGDAKAFRTDLLWAAQQRKEEDATAKLSDLLGIEGGK